MQLSSGVWTSKSNMGKEKLFYGSYSVHHKSILSFL